MSLVPSLLQAIVRVDGEALVMHVGEKPYVVAASGQVDLAAKGLTLDAVMGIVGQLLPSEAMQALDDIGAVQFELAPLDQFPGDRFMVTAARGGDDVWAEIRRRPVVDERPAAAADAPVRAPAGPGPEDGSDPLALPREDQLWPAQSAPAQAEADGAIGFDLLGRPSAEALPEDERRSPATIIPSQPPGASTPDESPMAHAPTDQALDGPDLWTAFADAPQAARLGDVQPEAVSEPRLEEARAAESADATGPEAAGTAELPSALSWAADLLSASRPASPEAAAAPAAIPAPESPTPESATAAGTTEPQLAAHQFAEDVASPAVASKMPPAVFEPATAPPAVAADLLQAATEPAATASRAASPARPTTAPREPAPQVGAAPSGWVERPGSSRAGQTAHANDLNGFPPEIGMPGAAHRAPSPSDGVFTAFGAVGQPAVVLPLDRAARPEGVRHGAELGFGALERMVRQAAARGASVLYLSSHTRPAARIDGEVQNLEGLPTLGAGEMEALLLAAVPERHAEALHAGQPAEWVWDLPEVGRIRCSIFSDHRGPGAVLRVVSAVAPAAEQLGLSREVQSLSAEAEGLIVVSGPRGAGKSTLIGSLVDLINRSRRDYVITFEREINIVHPRHAAFVSQREIRGTADDLAVAARAALREDPDVLVFDELVSAPLMDVAIDAVQTGRLVVAGVRASHLSGAVERIVELYPTERRRQVLASLAQSLRAVVSQVLVKKVPGGRAAAREVLLNSPIVASVLAEGRTGQLSMAIEGGRRQGMVPLNDALAALVQTGTVDVREAYRHAVDRGALLDVLKRYGVDTSPLERLA
jgi:twitching motility protein PilT